MQLHCRSIRRFCHPNVQIQPLPRLEKQDVVAIVYIRQLHQRAEIPLGIQLCVLARMGQHAQQIPEQMSLSERYSARRQRENSLVVQLLVDRGRILVLVDAGLLLLDMFECGHCGAQLEVAMLLMMVVMMDGGTNLSFLVFCSESAPKFLRCGRTSERLAKSLSIRHRKVFPLTRLARPPPDPLPLNTTERATYTTVPLHLQWLHSLISKPAGVLPQRHLLLPVLPSRKPIPTGPSLGLRNSPSLYHIPIPHSQRH